MADESINNIVTIITQRVLEKLNKSPYSPLPPTGENSVPLCPCPGAVDPSLCLICGHCASKRASDITVFQDAGAVRISSGLGIGEVSNDLAKYIDHTLLKSEATKNDLRKLCEEAAKYAFYSVCVNSANVRFCANLLQGSGVKIVAVVGFPLGAMAPDAKAYEAKQAIRDGAREIDMVINIGALKSGDYYLVYEDISKVVQASKPYPVKVIIETGSLSDEQKVVASAITKAAGAHFVKTSTGFGAGGAKVEDIELIKKVVGGDIGIKASGGIKTTESAQAMIKAGATRIGASASIAIVTGKKPA